MTRFSERPLESSPEDRRQHLEFIQAAILRMSTASSTVKGWVLPMVTLVFGFALTQDSASVTVLGVVSVALFGFLDSQYLRRERAYRALFSAVVGGGIPPYQMEVDPLLKRPNENCKVTPAPAAQWRKVLASWSILGFYGPLLLVGLLVGLWCSASQ